MMRTPCWRQLVYSVRVGTQTQPLRVHLVSKRGYAAPKLRARSGDAGQPRSNKNLSLSKDQARASEQPKAPKPALKAKETLADRPVATTFTTAVLFISGTAFFGLLGWYGTKYYLILSKPDDDIHAHEHIDLTAVYDDYAPHFDKDVDRTEYWNGIMTLRSRLVKQAKGDVLESAAGTGRNSEYYVQPRIRSLTIVDKSKGMLNVAERKWPEERKGEDWSSTVKFVVGDVEDERTRAGLVPAQFDTVVQTLGLCSTDDPDGLMRSLTQLVKPGGKILLLEHGRTYFDWMNKMLDASAHGHAAKHGCWWNRDIGAIVSRSGMEIVELSRTWLSAGSNWYVVLRKPVERDTPRKST